MRSGGILLHPTALPGDGWAGDLGHAHRFIEWLRRARMSLWQVLPLSPPGPGHSPYASLSTRAGNPALIDLRPLAREGLVDEARLGAALSGQGVSGQADLDRAANAKDEALSQAAARFATAKGKDRDDFLAWCEAQGRWLVEDAAFHAASRHHGTTDWRRWPGPLARARPDAVDAFVSRHADLVHRWQFVQWQFDRQWQALWRRARSFGIRIVGDLPIYCSLQSVDVWANQGLFELDARGEPLAVAGVPPDLFSETGQHWGNPLYRWDRHHAEGYEWWCRRIAGTLARCDLLRLDHFRGLASYWRIPAGSRDARSGAWVPGPGRALFDAIFATTPREALIIEDLGMLTDDVFALRDELGLPGMRVLQFGFGPDGDASHLPHSFVPAAVAYTGTHDNDTTLGWWQQVDAAVRRHVRDYCGGGERRIDRRMVRLAFASVADLAIVPMQDVIGAGSEARMNRPGEGEAQWRWRMRDHELRDADGRYMARLARLYDRAPRPSPTSLAADRPDRDPDGVRPAP